MRVGLGFISTIRATLYMMGLALIFLRDSAGRACS